MRASSPFFIDDMELPRNPDLHFPHSIYVGGSGTEYVYPDGQVIECPWHKVGELLQSGDTDEDSVGVTTGDVVRE